MLSRDVVKAIGAMPSWVWDASYAAIHHDPFPKAIDDSEEEQSFRQFVDMGKREPNERGTGRWLVTEERMTIALVCIGDVEKKTVESVKSFLSAFFHGMKVELHPSLSNVTILKSDEIRAAKTGNKKKRAVNRCTLAMGSYAYSIEQAFVSGEHCLEVFSLFDMLVHAVQKDQYCVIALVNGGICEQVDDEYLPVLGRACGDRVCVVDARHASAENKVENRRNPILINQDGAKQNLRTLLATTAHESLHCFGLDHCITWQCIMNSQQVEEHEFLFLSPLNLKKLVHAILPPKENNVEKVHRYLSERYQVMAVTLNDLGFSDDAAWAYRKKSLLVQATEIDKKDHPHPAVPPFDST